MCSSGRAGSADAGSVSGGPRRTPKEAVAALAEGIEIIRATWDTTQRSVRLDGEHYRAAGVHPGPAPAHDIEIWIGAIGPKMLALTGRVGDGWLPSQAYVPPEQLAEKNGRIDDAALAAGREPAQIRRLYNVNPSTDPAWAESLAELAVEHGISTFIVAGDDPRLVQELGTEIAPAVRELVTRERARGGVETPTSAIDEPPLDEATGEPSRSAPAESVAVSTTRTRPENAPRPTPDDGGRRSDRRPWDDATRPTYASTAAPLAWTAHERAAGQHLIDVHDHLRTELKQLFDLIDQVAAGTLEAGRARSLINTMTLRQNDWTLGAYCQSYCRLVTTHHSIEDSSMFPHLRSADDGLAPVIDRLEAEHHVIAGVLDEVDRGLVAVVSGPEGMAELRRAVDLLSDTMTSHLSYEERELVEPLARFGFY